jgi:hypothetical protein
MQHLLNKLNFQFGTSAAAAEAYSPFNKVDFCKKCRKYMISIIEGARCSRIGEGSQGEKPNTSW